MVVGIGIDLMDVSKMEDSIKSEAFIRKVFTDTEVAECHSMANAAERLAGKFAAKEAFMKALGKGIRQGIWFTQVEVLNEESGQPYIQIHGELKKTLLEMGVTTIHVSVTHTRSTAAAVVVFENRDDKI